VEVKPWRIAFEDEHGVVVRQFESEVRPPLYASVVMLLHDAETPFPRGNDFEDGYTADVKGVFVGKEYERASISTAPDDTDVQRGAVYRPRVPKGE
jgi:hypothetical protein